MAEIEAQVAYILEEMVSTAVSEVSKVVDGSAGGCVNAAEAEPVDQKVFNLSFVMATLAQDAVEKLCQLFHESKVTEMDELRRRLEKTENDLRLVLESREKPLTEEPDGTENVPPSSETRRRVVVICETALKHMPFFRQWKHKKNGVQRLTVQDKGEQKDGLLESDEECVEQLDGRMNHQMVAAVEPVNTHLAYISKQTTYISRLVQKVRNASVERIARRHRGPKPKALPDSYKCSVCTKTFYRQKSLDLHMLVHTGEKPYLCDVCGKGFIRKESLTTHQRLHSSVRPFKCDTCDKSFYLRNHLSRHKAVHTQERPYKCQYCDKAFRNTGNLKRHVFLHTGERPYICDYCGRGFVQNVTLQAHRLTHTGVKPFKCHCGKAYTQRNTLRSHQLTHSMEIPWDSTISCVVCGALENPESLQEHLLSHTLPCFCVKCNQQLDLHSELQNHQKEHNAKRPHVCPICNKSFQSSTYLKIHVHNHSKESELNKKPYQCTICGRGFAHQTTLTYHQALHSGEKPFTCRTCGKSFSNPGNVHRHQLIHTGEKPYSCQLCGRSFNQSSSLKAHLRTHTGHKPYMCDHCGKSFSNRRSLKEHKCRSV